MPQVLKSIRSPSGCLLGASADRGHVFVVTICLTVASLSSSTSFGQEKEPAGKTVEAVGASSAKSRPRVVIVKPVVLCDDDGANPAPYVLPKKLVDRVYTKAGLEFVYLEPVMWKHGKGRRGEVNLNQIVKDGRRQGTICADRRVVTLLFVSAVDGRGGPLGRGMQNGNICFVTLGPRGVDSDPDMQAFVVAHEVGHCLNLRHAVDDPAVPDDVPNLQGDGPYGDRLAVAGLHESQRDTVLRSPLVNERVKFHSLEEAKSLIVDESWERYISDSTDDMLRFSIGLKAGASIPQQAEARVRFAAQSYATKVLEFSDEEKELLKKLIARLQKLTGKDWPSVSRLPWQFMKSQATFCRGMAHTRGLSILLSQRYLDRMASDEAYGLKLLLHEKMHVIQRLNAVRFESLYRSYGFQRIQLADGELARINAAQNPDALDAGWAIQLNDSLSTLVTVLSHGEDGSLEFKEEYRQLDKRSDGAYVIGKVTEKDAAFESWKRGFPFRVGHDHPNEVSAYLSGLLLEVDYLKVDAGERSEEQDRRLDQTREAFRKIMGIEGE